MFWRDYRDPDEYVAGNGLNSFRLARPLSSNFRAHAMGIDLGRLAVLSGEAMEPVTTVGGISAVHAFTFALRPAAPRMLSGHEVPYRTLFHHRPNEMMTGRSPSGQP